MNKINNKIKSEYFIFRDFKKSNNFKIFFHKGWNNLFIFRVDFLKKTKEKNFFVKNKIFNNNRYEKALILTKGNAILNNRNYKKNLKKFDCLHIMKSLESFNFEFKKGTQLFIIIRKKNSSISKKINYFNFEKNLKKINIWGGKIISRIFNGYDMTIVLFKLKKGFKFHDKGHRNEQITWLIKGKMKFYYNNNHKSLEANKTSVDIGPHDSHGGVSMGAIGFDVFSPKRSEKRYS